jgi:replicative DNA helicase
LDRITNGWVKGSITILGGRPAMGKTSLLLDIARKVAVDFDMPVAYFSLELSVTQVSQRMMSSLSGIETRHLQAGKVTTQQWDTLHDSMDGLSQSQLFIDDTANLSLFEFREKCRALKASSDIDLVLVDHIQLMKHSERRMQNRDRELSEICKGLKGIARELDIAIVVSSQLSRAVETRGGDKRPMLSDLRESGALEQDADLVLFLYRPEYYGITEDWHGKGTEGIAEVIVSKNRFGPTGTAELKFDGRTSSFSELEDHDDDSAFNGVRAEDFF